MTNVPYEHGVVLILDGRGESDLDQGNYKRSTYTNKITSKKYRNIGIYFNIKQFYNLSLNNVLKV